MIVYQPRQSDAKCLILCREATIHSALGQRVDMHCEEFGVRQLVAITDEIWQLTLGGFARVRLNRDVILQAQLGHKHFSFQTKWADVLQPKGTTQSH